MLELGNTQVAQFAGSGALMELDKADFENSDTWLGGLEESSTYDGRLVAVPYYAGVRVGIYRTDLAEQASANPPFNSLDEMQAAGVKLLEAHGDDGSFSGLYYPSQYWYEGISFIWDAGGDIATQAADGTWTGTLDSPEAKAGLERLKDLVAATSRGGDGQNEADDALVMAQDQAAMFIDASWKPAVVSDPETGNPELKDKVKIFVVPGSKPGTVLPQFLGGSDIAINAKTPNADLATAYTAMLTGQKYQEVLAGKGYIANSTSFEPKAGDETSAVVITRLHRPVHPELEELDEDRGRERAAEHVRQDPHRIGDDRRGNRRGERTGHRAAQQLIVSRRPARNSNGVPGRSAARHLFVHRQFRRSTAMT